MKAIFILLFFFIALTCLHAQTSKIEVRGGWGYLSDSHCSEVIDNSIGAFFSAFFGKQDFKITARGPVSGEVLMSLKNPSWQLAFTYTHEKIEITQYRRTSSASLVRNINTLLPGIYYNYVRQKGFSLYSGMAIGLKLSSYDDHISNSHVANIGYHLTALGLRFGNKLAGFCEGGFGAKGLIRGGIAYAF